MAKTESGKLLDIKDGERIKRLRKALGLTQFQFGCFFEYSQSTVHQWEYGKICRARVGAFDGLRAFLVEPLAVEHRDLLEQNKIEVHPYSPLALLPTNSRAEKVEIVINGIFDAAVSELSWLESLDALEWTESESPLKKSKLLHHRKTINPLTLPDPNAVVEDNAQHGFGFVDRLRLNWLPRSVMNQVSQEDLENTAKEVLFGLVHRLVFHREDSGEPHWASPPLERAEVTPQSLRDLDNLDFSQFFRFIQYTSEEPSVVDVIPSMNFLVGICELITDADGRPNLDRIRLLLDAGKEWENARARVAKADRGMEGLRSQIDEAILRLNGIAGELNKARKRRKKAASNG